MFESGESSKSISIDTYEDNLVESEEYFYVEILNPVGNMSLGSVTRSDATISDNDVESEAFNFAGTSAEVKEGQTQVVKIIRSGSLVGVSTVDYSISYGTASQEDLSTTNGTLTFSEDISEQTISLVTVDDTILEESETLRVSLMNPSSSAGVGSNDAFDLSIIDNDTSLAFESAQVRVIEGGSTVITILRQGDLSNVSSVNYATQTGTAGGADFTSLEGQLGFNPGDSKKSITLVTQDDDDVEEDESLVIKLSNPSANTVLRSTDEIEVVIADNDSADDKVTFIKDVYTMTEGESKEIEVIRLGDLSGTIEVDFDITLENASAADYSITDSPLVFSENESSKVITITALDDTVSEDDESLQVVLIAPENSTTLGSIDSVTLKIQDDDSKVFFSTPTGSVVEGQVYESLILRSGDISKTDTISYTVATGTASEEDVTPVTESIVFQPGETSKVIEAQTIDDALVEDTETFSISLVADSGDIEIESGQMQTVSIIENDINVDTFNFSASSKDIIEGESGTVKLLRTGVLDGSMTVTYSVENISSSLSDHSFESGSVVFQDGESEKMLFVETTEDAWIENTETFKISLDTSTGYSKIGSLNQLLVNIKDDDSSFAFVSDTYSIVEGESAVVTVVRDGNLSLEESVDYRVIGDSAGALDYTETSGTLSYGLGEISKTISVNTYDDSLTEETETFKILLDNPSESASIGDLDETNVWITDNDDQMTVFNFSSSSKTIVEGEQADISVIRTGSSSGQVSVLYSVSSGTANSDDYEVIAGTLTFDDGETLKKNTCYNKKKMMKLKRRRSLPCRWYPHQMVQSWGALSTVKLSILDDDTLSDSASFESGVQTVQEGKKIELVIERTGDLNEEASIEYLVANGTATSSDVSSTKGTVTFGVGEGSKRIEIPVVLDSQNEEDEYLYVLLHNPSSGLEVGDVSTVIVVIENTQVLKDQEEDRVRSNSQASGSSAEESSRESASVVTSLSNVLIGKATGENNIQPQTITAYYSHIDQALNNIKDGAPLRKALESYVDGVDALSKVAEDAQNEVWVESQLLERINVYSRTVADLEDYGDLTKEFLESIESIQKRIKLRAVQLSIKL